MIVLPTSDELRDLEAFDHPFCVTIYAPPAGTEGTGANRHPHQIELKNLLHRAEVELLDEGLAPQDVKKTLDPAWRVILNPEFRPIRSESFVLFAHRRLFRLYHLPAELPHLVSIGHGFQLAPLQEALKGNQPYLVLALSHKRVRMFEGDRFRIRRLRLKRFPSDMKESLNIDEYPKASETHAIGPAGEKGSEAYHGQYNENETDKEMLFLFFRKIDASLRKFLQRRGEPLVLAGVEYLLPIYRQANTSPYLVPGGLVGNMENERPDSIRERAWKLVNRKE